MNIPTLLEDLMKDFQQGRQVNLQTIELTDQLVTKIKKPFAYRFFQTGISLFLELILWIAMVACFTTIIFMERLYPFSILGHLKLNPNFPQITEKDLNIFIWVLRGIFLILGFTFLWVARSLAKGRRSVKFLNNINKDLRSLMEQLLRRRSSFQELTLKYPVDLPEGADGIITPGINPPANHGTDEKKYPDNPNDILL